MARKKKNKAEGLRGDEWMATYADTVTLLLTFFVLLYSMATVDAEKTKSISNAFTSMMSGQNGDSIMEYNMYNGEVPLIGGETEDNIEGGESLTEQEKMYKNVKEFVNENNLGSVVDILDNKRGVIIQLRDNVLFETSSSDLREESKEVLNKINSLIASIDNQILVEGHTDNRPINTSSVLFETSSSDLREESKEVLNKINSLIASIDNQILVEGHTDNRPINTSRFPSNWELSADRAVNVVKYFIEVMGQDPSRFSAAGYGEHHPVAPNDTYENMAKNRRVDILIVTTEKEEE